MEAYSSDTALEDTYTYICVFRWDSSGSGSGEGQHVDWGHASKVEPIQPADMLNVGCGDNI